MCVVFLEVPVVILNVFTCIGFLTYDDLISWCWLRLIIVALWLEPITTTTTTTSLEVFIVITSTITTTTGLQTQYWNILLVAELAALLLNIVTMVQMMSITKMILTLTVAADYLYKIMSQVAMLSINIVLVEVWSVVLLYAWWGLVPTVNHWLEVTVVSVFRNFVLQETSQHLLEMGMQIFVCLFLIR